MLVEMINIIKEYSMFGLIVVGILCLFYLIGYYFIYRKLFNGKKSFNLKKSFIITIFISYIFLVLGATMLGRLQDTLGGINLELFSSYRKAIFSFSIFAWRDIILNIIMFIPLGFLLPLLNKIFYKPYSTLLLSFCFTLGIEIVQLITKIGAFDLDDIFNNFLGAIIGYCVVMTILSATSENKHKKRNIALYIVPLLLIATIFSSFFISYNF